MYNLSTGRREPAVCPLILRTEPRMGSFRAQLIDEFFRLTDKTAGTKPAEEVGSTGFRRAVRVIRTVLICFAAALYVFYFITNLRAMSIGGGILSASLLALFTFAAYKAVPLVLKTLVGERLCSFVPVPNARRDFSRIMLAALAIHIVTTILGMVLYRVFTPDFSGNLFELWETSWSKHNTDVPHYINIAENWYVNDGKDRLLIVFIRCCLCLCECSIRSFTTALCQLKLSTQLQRASPPEWHI